MSKISSGREREAKLIHQANRAAAVGQLMLGELNNWQQFLKADTFDFISIPRRNLKAAFTDVRGRLSKEIRRFCSCNFLEMDEKKLSLLYEEIKAYRGIEIPLPEFEKNYSRIRRDVLKGNPAHATVCISLWGLQFKFPEDELSKDLITALHLISEAHTNLNTYKTKSHLELQKDRQKISLSMRKRTFAARSSVLCCFNLLEAYLNGLAWDYMQTCDKSSLSNQKRKLLEDTNSVSIRDKLSKYPEIITGRKLWKEPDEELDGFVDILKPYRDSLVHPSPFFAPEKFGGYDKLRLFYRVDNDTAVTTVSLLVRIIKRIHNHIQQDGVAMPAWVCDLESEANNTSDQLS